MIRIKKRSITILEDNPLIALMLSKMLTKEGYRIDNIYCNPDDFIHNINVFRSDLLISDLDLGSDLAGDQAVRQLSKRKEVPVIFYSDCADQPTITRCLLLPNTRFISKNSSVKKLIAAVLNALNQGNNNIALAS